MNGGGIHCHEGIGKGPGFKGKVMSLDTLNLGIFEIFRQMLGRQLFV